MAYERVTNQKGGDGSEHPDGPINKWTVIGQTAEGSYGGRREGKFGPLFQIGGRTWAGHTVLSSALKDIPVGTQVKVVYLGKVRGQSGVEYKNFDVFVDRGESASATPQAATPLDQLYQQILNEKGPVIANALLAATQMSSDPLEALRDAAKQIGVEEVPF
jgi:hypothetical protein